MCFCLTLRSCCLPKTILPSSDWELAGFETHRPFVNNRFVLEVILNRIKPFYRLHRGLTIRLLQGWPKGAIQDGKHESDRATTIDAPIENEKVANTVDEPLENERD